MRVGAEGRIRRGEAELAQQVATAVTSRAKPSLRGKMLQR